MIFITPREEPEKSTQIVGTGPWKLLTQVIKPSPGGKYYNT